MRGSTMGYGSASRGFTLIELLVVISIIGFLSSVVIASLNGARKKARDATRLSTLHQLQNALELYATDNAGSYPSTSGNWQAVCSGFGSHTTSGSTCYIPNLAPTYISVLPTDPVSNVCGYLYRSDGNNYMLLSYGTVETYTRTTNLWARPVYNGTLVPCGSSGGYENDFAVYTRGAMCW